MAGGRKMLDLDMVEVNGTWRLKKKEVKLTFDQGFFVAVKAIQKLRSLNAGKAIAIGIAGPSGAGKSSIAKKILQVIPKSLIITLDNYLDSTRGIFDENFDDPRLIDFDLLEKNIVELQNGQPTESPLYDFRKSGRYAYKTLTTPESRVVIVEGTYALHERLRQHYHLCISISGGVHLDLIKRILRDINRTGQEPHEAINQITETVYPMFKAFIEPDLKHAEIRIMNSYNPFSGLLNPLYIMKSFKTVTEEEILACMKPKTMKPKEIKKYYDIYLRPGGADAADSDEEWIRIRNTDGVYMLMFSEEIKEGGFIISPRVSYQVSVKTLGGLMALGYEMGAIIHRQSTIYRDEKLTISIDSLDELKKTCTQIKSRDRKLVQKMAERLDLMNSLVSKSYIEIYQESGFCTTRSIKSAPSHGDGDSLLADLDRELAIGDGGPTQSAKL